MTDLTLVGYWRSSCTWRVRLALGAKGLSWRTEAVHLLRDGGDQHRPEHRQRNALGQVPVLLWREGGADRSLSQSLAILEWIEERAPVPALLPADPWLRARARMLAEVVNSGIQPLQNLSVIRSPRLDDGNAFAREAIERGLAALDALSAPTAGRFLVGDEPSIADLCLVPQLYNARRFSCPLDAHPRLLAAEAALSALPWAAAAHPDAQPDAA